MSVENKKATTIDEQVQILQERGMVIDDEKKLKEHLLDIGYYRLGFYWFPFEKTYPRLSKRDHNFKEGTNVDFAIKLYYFGKFGKSKNYISRRLHGFQILPQQNIQK